MEGVAISVGVCSKEVDTLQNERISSKSEMLSADPAEADVGALVQIFNEKFADSESTELVVGAEEPLYLPASETGALCQVISRLDYFSSALHEISHWCIAGKERRKLVDFGYWYEPDGRTEQQQREFESVEVKPQALEWIMTKACGMRFRLSVDNVAQPELGASERFMENVADQACRYIEEGLPDRAGKFVQALIERYQIEGFSLNKSDFLVDKLY